MCTLCWVPFASGWGEICWGRVWSNWSPELNRGPPITGNSPSAAETNILNAPHVNMVELTNLLKIYTTTDELWRQYILITIACQVMLIFLLIGYFWSQWNKIKYPFFSGKKSNLLDRRIEWYDIPRIPAVPTMYADYFNGIAWLNPNELQKFMLLLLVQ